MLDSRVFCWSPSGDLSGNENVGDTLGPSIARKIAQGLGYSRWRPEFEGRLFAVGSTLHYAQDGDVIWGVGINGKISGSSHQFKSLDVRAVRGPRTRHFLENNGISCPPVFGDPGILCALMWPLPYPARREGITYVPHFRESLSRHSDYELDNVQILSPFSALFHFLEEIVSSSLVLSSSLHGIVIAESYGVPAVLVENQCGETLLKYADYYEGTGRCKFMVAKSISEALAYDAEAPDLSVAQEALLDAFPHDLFQK